MRTRTVYPQSCPFCGAEPELQYGELTRTPGMNFARLTCPRCQATMMSNHPFTYEDEARREIVRRWNERHDRSLMKDFVKELRATLKTKKISKR